MVSSGDSVESSAAVYHQKVNKRRQRPSRSRVRNLVRRKQRRTARRYASFEGGEQFGWINVVSQGTYFCVNHARIDPHNNDWHKATKVGRQMIRSAQNFLRMWLSLSNDRKRQHP